MAVSVNGMSMTTLENDTYTIDITKKGVSVRYVSDVTLKIDGDCGERECVRLPIEHMDDFYEIVEALKEYV